MEPLVYALVKNRPANPVAFAIAWLKDYADKQRKHNDSDSEGEEEEQQVAELEAKLIKKKAQGKSRSRMAISEEVFGCFNKKETVELAEVPKDQETTLLIKSLIRNSILFQNIDSRDEEALIKAMGSKNYAAGEQVIAEGERGDDLFIVESGEYECSKVIDGEERYLKTYSHGEAFGELALMYNAPRAATIVCKQPGTLYTLDRITFSQVVKQAAFKKRELYKNVIDKIEVFSSINAVEKYIFRHLDNSFWTS